MSDAVVIGLFVGTLLALVRVNWKAYGRYLELGTRCQALEVKLASLDTRMADRDEIETLGLAMQRMKFNFGGHVKMVNEDRQAVETLTAEVRANHELFGNQIDDLRRRLKPLELLTLELLTLEQEKKLRNLEQPDLGG